MRSHSSSSDAATDVGSGDAGADLMDAGDSAAATAADEAQQQQLALEAQAAAEAAVNTPEENGAEDAQIAEQTRLAAEAEQAADARTIECIQEDAVMLGERLSQGHGYDEHHAQFGDGVTRQQYADIASGIIAQPDEARVLPRDRAGFWSDQHQAAVFLDERSEDGGTMFKPDNGKAYFDGQ